jgi:beta-phosphoglucomutase family hydrolase
MTAQLHLEALDGAIFDMDGVVTDTAAMHEQAWKRVFDAVLQARGDQRLFSHEDYVDLVDGRPRRDGALAFLASRGIEPGEDELDDVCTDKNAAFRDALDETGVTVLPGARQLLQDLRDRGLHTGLFTASRNAADVLRSGDLADAFDARVDGEIARELGLPGKPAPDVPLELADRLGVAPSRCAFFEDSRAGIRAGLAGRFAVVIGVAGGEAAAALRRLGAHATVASLAEVELVGA